jgi:hypothetical protein
VSGLREAGTLTVCVDCHYWAHYGWEEGANYPEGWEGPEEPLLSAHYVDTLADEPHYSRSQCEGCGSGLSGDRQTVTVYVREESAVETVLTLTVRATANTEELARHLTTDAGEQQRIRSDAGAAAEALAVHLRPMLEEHCWDSPAALSVTAVVAERRAL